MLAKFDMIGCHFDEIVKGQIGHSQVCLQETESIPELRLGVRCDRQIGTRTGDAREEQEIAGVEDGRKMPVVRVVGELSRRQRPFHRPSFGRLQTSLMRRSLPGTAQSCPACAAFLLPQARRGRPQASSSMVPRQRRNPSGKENGFG